MPAKPKRAMPSFQKAPPELVRAFETAVASLAEHEVRKVFGYPCLFVNGYMTVGLFGEQFFVRLSEADAARLTALGGKPLTVMPGRAMAGYTAAPKAIWSASAKLRPWVERAVAQARSLSPRAPAKRAGSLAKKTSRKRR